MYKNINDPRSGKSFNIESSYGLGVLKKYVKLLHQHGGKCGLCGLDGHNRRTCPHKQEKQKTPLIIKFFKQPVIKKTLPPTKPEIQKITQKKSRKQRTCKLCGAVGVTQKTCPLNHAAKKVNYKKHNTESLETIASPSNGLPIIKSIVGPTDMYYLEVICPNKTIKKILLFSDTHTNIIKDASKTQPNCMHLDDVFDMIIDKAETENKCIDMFVEAKLRKNNAPKYLKGGKLKINKQVLHQINSKYLECSRHAQNNSLGNGVPCNNSNLRFHNLDVRFVQPKSGHRRVNKLDSLLYYMQKPSNTELSHEKHFDLIAKYILGYNLNVTDMMEIKKIIDIILVDNKASLEPNTPIAIRKYTPKQVMREMKSFRKTIIKEYKKFSKTSKKYLPHELGGKVKLLDLRTTVKQLVNNNFNKVQRFDEYTHLFTDLYVLSRIFLEFKTNKNKISRSPEGCSVINESGKKTINISPNRVIILAGGDHISFYKNILNYYFPDAYKFQTCDYKKDKIINSDESYVHTQPRNIKVSSFTEIFNRFLE